MAILYSVPNLLIYSLEKRESIDVLAEFILVILAVFGSDNITNARTKIWYRNFLRSKLEKLQSRPDLGHPRSVTEACQQY